MAIGATVFEAVTAPYFAVPQTKPYAKRAIGWTILIGSNLCLVGLALFNIFTQGHEDVTSTIVSQTYYSEKNPLKKDTSTTSCVSSLLDVSTSYYTRLPTLQGNNSGPNALVEPGSFKWTINTFGKSDKETVRASYNGEALNCNATNIGLTHHFTGNTFNFGLCAQCSLVDRQESTFGDDSRIDVFGLCSQYSRELDDWPAFTETTITGIGTRLSMGVQRLYPEITFNVSDLPKDAYPFYYAYSAPANRNLTITPERIDYINTWLGGLLYSNGSYTLSGNTNDTERRTDLSLLFNLTENFVCGSVLPVLGIGNVQPPMAYNGDLSRLPEPLPTMYTEVLGASKWVLDKALEDLNGRALATSFTCTVKKNEWKAFWTIVAIVVGNTLGVFGAILTAMLAVGSIVDERIKVRNEKEGGPAALLLPLRQWSGDSTTPQNYQLEVDGKTMYGEDRELWDGDKR
ncbi:hypothetical protein CYLTODRAFT_458724 [Cylindrobasidium torrendii FP15055 ss-10]|uniref:Uncharacterized protein n=1 Tax=Cylindrobasidium torrendii FP15055 ss-10 TaxID=1314674 RepID=A0A0D7AXS0_9AGAR|nr:hypothetical protein CYLTODRAFT_458724 [Cylindrobasidium torrendii FP15055 ss-10]